MVAVTPDAAASEAPGPYSLRLVLRHRYNTGSSTDSSGHGNDGAVVGGRFQPTTDDEAGGLELDGRDDRVVVRPSASLTHIGGLRVDVTTLVHSLGDRCNLVEGYLSFALFVHGDGSVQGGVYERSGWLTLRSRPGVVEPGRWTRLTYACHPRHGSHLAVDGALVHHDGRIPAGFGDVSWPFGVNIGGWPDADLFMLRGLVADVRIWVDDGRRG